MNIPVPVFTIEAKTNKNKLLAKEAPATQAISDHKLEISDDDSEDASESSEGSDSSDGSEGSESYEKEIESD